MATWTQRSRHGLIAQGMAETIIVMPDGECFDGADGWIRVDEEKLPVEVIIVEQVERPTEN